VEVVLVGEKKASTISSLEEQTEDENVRLAEAEKLAERSLVEAKEVPIY